MDFNPCVLNSIRIFYNIVAGVLAAQGIAIVSTYLSLNISVSVPVAIRQYHMQR